jgi:ABC-type amino acid transport substrate-binding protein
MMLRKSVQCLAAAAAVFALGVPSAGAAECSNDTFKKILDRGKIVVGVKADYIWVYDDSSLMADLASGNWDEFEMPLKTEDDNPWGLAVPRAEKDCIFGQFMSGMTYNWLQDGTLIGLEKKWGIQPTQYLVDQKQKFSDWLEGAEQQ